MKPLIRFLAIFTLAFTTLLGATAASAESESELSQAELEQLLAPVALYPDTVLSHVLIAATYPLEVVQAERWVKANRDLSGESALKAVEEMDWDPSVKALVAFPQIVARMSEDLQWTQDLGDAFLADEEQVLESIQSLRERAYAAGSLDDLKHVRVEKEQKTIVIEPAVKEVVYVPYYDTRVVYGDWRWQSHPPVFWEYSHHFPNRHTGTHFSWSSGVSVHQRYVLSSFHWDRRHVVVVDVGHYPTSHYYTTRHIIQHRSAHRWRHDPHHRRGAHYSRGRLRREYGRDLHPPRQDDRGWAKNHRRVPDGRYSDGMRERLGVEKRSYPTSSVTERRYGRHPNVDTSSTQRHSNRTLSTPNSKTHPGSRLVQPRGNSSGVNSSGLKNNVQRPTPGRTVQPPANTQRAHPIRNSPRSSGTSSSNTSPGGGRPSSVLPKSQRSNHLRSGDSVNRLK